MVRFYELSSFHTGRWILEARSQSGVTVDVLVVNVNGAMHTGFSGNAGKIFAGFDRSDYPGDTVMRDFIQKTNLCWCGFYLAPAPYHKDASWMGKRRFLQGLGWGMAPIYLGRQVESEHLTAAQGTLDAQHAAKLAKNAGFPGCSIIFLDVEQGPPLNASMLAYYKAWTSELEDKTAYKSGVYCTYLQLAQALYTGDSRPIFWVFNLNKYSCNPNAPAEKRICPTSPFPAPDPKLSGVAFAKLWQLAQGKDFKISAGNSSIKTVDLDSSVASDPSDPNSY